MASSGGTGRGQGATANRKEIERKCHFHTSRRLTFTSYVIHKEYAAQ